MKVSAYASHSAKGELKPLDYEAADPGPLEVDVRVTHCGVCHSDLSMIDNEWGWAEYPLVPGHEVIGEVVVVGKQVTEPKVGERVGVGFQSGSCLTCRYCRQGKEHLCNNREWTIVGRHAESQHLVIKGRCSLDVLVIKEYVAGRGTEIIDRINRVYRLAATRHEITKQYADDEHSMPHWETSAAYRK